MSLRAIVYRRGSCSSARTRNRSSRSRCGSTGMASAAGKDARDCRVIASLARCNNKFLRASFPDTRVSAKGVMSVTSVTAGAYREESTALRVGVWLMTFGAIAFIGYAVIFFVRNFTDSFLELGIGAEQVSVGKTEIEAFSPSLYDYIGHLGLIYLATAVFVVGAALALKALVESSRT